MIYPISGEIYHAAAAMAMAAVVTSQIGNLLAHRSETLHVWQLPLFGNRLVWVGIGVELALLLALMYVPLLQQIFGMAPFAWPYWLFLFAWAPVLVAVDEVRKSLSRWRR